MQNIEQIRTCSLTAVEALQCVKFCCLAAGLAAAGIIPGLLPHPAGIWLEADIAHERCGAQYAYKCELSGKGRLTKHSNAQLYCIGGRHV